MASKGIRFLCIFYILNQGNILTLLYQFAIMALCVPVVRNKSSCPSLSLRNYVTSSGCMFCVYPNTFLVPRSAYAQSDHDTYFTRWSVAAPRVILHYSDES